VKRPEYARIRVPALAFFAPPGSVADLPGYARGRVDDATLTQAVIAMQERVRVDRALFAREVLGAKVVDLVGASHYVFLSNPDDVVREIGTFAGMISR
jgi:hypothetical protein